MPDRRRRLATPKPRLAIAAIMSALLAAGCGHIPLPGPLGRLSEAGVGSKAVAQKLDPNVLVAVDDTYCEVSVERWERIDVGDNVLCNWRRNRPSLQPWP